MAGYNLYLKLMSGEVVHVTDAWDGAAPTEEGMVDSDGVAVDANGKEVSDPYRDIHRHTASIYPAEGSLQVGGEITTSAAVTVAAALVPTELVTVEEVYYIWGGDEGTHKVKSPVPDGFSTSPSDEVAHKKPRQFAKVYTWLIFSEDPSGPVHKWRKSEVMGWGCMAPIDI